MEVACNLLSILVYSVMYGAATYDEAMRTKNARKNYFFTLFPADCNVSGCKSKSG